MKLIKVEIEIAVRAAESVPIGTNIPFRYLDARRIVVLNLSFSFNSNNIF